MVYEELRRLASQNYVRDGVPQWLMLSNLSPSVGRQSLLELTGSDTEFHQLKKHPTKSNQAGMRGWEDMPNAAASSARSTLFAKSFRQRWSRQEDAPRPRLKPRIVLSVR